MSTDRPEDRLSGLDPSRADDVAGWSASPRGRAARDRVTRTSRTAGAGSTAPERTGRRRVLRTPAGAFSAVVTGTVAAAVALSVAGTTPGLPLSSPASAAALEPFGGCADLAAYYADTAQEQITPFGLAEPGGGDGREFAAPAAPGGSLAFGAGEESAASGLGSLDSRSSATDASAADPLTGTNLQERGVDEPDVAKTDGERLVLLRGDELVVLDVSGDEPRETGRVAVPALAGSPGGVPGPAEIRPAGPSGELLLDGDRVLVLSTTTSYGGPQPLAGTDAPADGATTLVPAPTARERTTLQVVELGGSDPALGPSAEYDGRLVDVRLADGALRVALSTAPVGLALQQPVGGGVRAEEDAQRANEEAVRTADAQAWLPGRVLRDADGEAVASGPLLACEAVSRPPEPAGVRTLSLLTLDLAGEDPLRTADARAVVADGATLYASADRLVVATSPASLPWWGGAADDARTSLHAFDTTDPATTTYLASGEVGGVVPGRWGLSERDGLLRVVTTTRASDGSTASALAVLERDGEELVERGRVGGIGLGEDVYAVRFLGDAAYVVTFRQIDPLHVVDLSDPTSPRLAGELEVPGFSSYLHPVGDGRLLGVGQDADPATGMTLGAQASLFDVADPDAPTRVDTVEMGEGEAFVQHDSRAFAFDGERGLAVVPFSAWRRGATDVVGIAVDGDQVRLAGRAQLPDAQVLRAFVDGDRVLAVGSGSVVVLALDEGLRVVSRTPVG